MPWTDVLTALSTAAIAITLGCYAVGSILVFRELRRAAVTIERVGETLQREILPAMQSARTVMEQVTNVAGSVQAEVDAVVETSRDLRGRVKRAANAAELRLTDLETLLDVVYEEVEDTALDVTAALRTTRRGVGIFSAMKRAFLRRGR